MKVEELKLYNIYKDMDIPNREYIYIGIDFTDDHCFLYKHEDFNILFLLLKDYGLDPDKIAKDLNLEIFIDEFNYKYIKGCDFVSFSEEIVEIYFKPILKDKLKNIINR
jgi:hypothetical protein